MELRHPWDAFPLDPNESVDTDGDGVGNNADTDDDGDGIPDAQDAFPLQRDGALSGLLSRQIKRTRLWPRCSSPCEPRC